jgi:cytosine/adenosine deaminase-related metal-dependent hydrolase
MTRKAIAGARIVTMDPAGTTYSDGAIVWEGDTLVYAGERQGAPLDGAEVEDGSDLLVLPGFVNAHSHAAQILLRGGPSHSRGLYDWLLNVVIPGLQAYSLDDLRLAVLLYTVEATRAGISTVAVNEEPVGDDADARARAALDVFAASGLRTFYAYMFRDRRPPQVGEERGVASAETLPVGTDAAQVLAHIEALAADYRERSGGHVDVWPSPATTAAASDAALRQVAAYAHRRGGKWALHLAETDLEHRVRDISPVAHLDRLGLLDSHLVAAHCLHVDSEDQRLLAARRAGVVTNPVSNSYLGSGIAPFPDMVEKGVRVALGTDDGNCNDSVNPSSDLKVLALLHRAVQRDARGGAPRDAGAGGDDRRGARPRDRRPCRFDRAGKARRPPSARARAAPHGSPARSVCRTCLPGKRERDPRPRDQW